MKLLPSNPKIQAAHQKGFGAYPAKSLRDCPYGPGGALCAAWTKGYLEAANWRPQPIPCKAPEGRERQAYGRIGAMEDRTRFSFPDDGPKVPRKEKFNDWLGYIPPRKGKQPMFRTFTRNPPKPKGDHYKEDK